MSQFTSQESFKGGDDIPLSREISRPPQSGGSPWFNNFIGLNPQLIDRLGNINPIAHRLPIDNTRPVDREVVVIPRYSFATQEAYRKL